MNNNVERRNFIKHSLATGIVAAASGSRILGANDRIRIGGIGLGRQGRGLISMLIKNQDVEIVALCDVFEPQIAQTISETRLNGVKTYKDFRQVLERKDVDAVIIATPDHWHALNTVMACQAGKDVYVEKPVSVTVAEGRKMVEAARRHSRIVQVGTQQRSGDHYQKAAEVIRSGQIGKVTYVRSWNFGNIAPDGIGNPPDSNPPPGLDWDMWLGPANKVPFNANRFGVHPDRYSSFRYFWDYAGGMMTDWGVHHIDIIQMIMGVDTPQAITAMGGKFAVRDNRDTPDTLSVTYEYPGFISTYENRECNGQNLNGRGYGILFHGTEASFFIHREAYEIVPERERRGIAASRVENANRQGETHIRNFLDCIKSRQLPTSDIEIGHRSTSTSLLGNVALRSSRRIVWNGKTEKIEGDQTGAKLLTREYRKPWKL